MERTYRGFASTVPIRNRHEQAGSAPGRDRRDDRLNPAARATNRALRGAEYGRFAAEIRHNLDPRGPLETLVARQVIRSAWRLKNDLDAADMRNEANTTPGGERAARSLEVAVTTLDLLQARRVEDVLHDPTPKPELGPDSGPFAWAGDDDRPVAESNEWPVLPNSHDRQADVATAADFDEDDTPIWRDRLVYDFDVSDLSPVVKGTWITVSHVVSLIIDGATWADILRTHPELCEADIRMCVAYAVAEEDSDR